MLVYDQLSKGYADTARMNRGTRLWNGSHDLHAFCSSEVEASYVVRIRG